MPNLFGVEVSEQIYELNKHLTGEKQPKSDARKTLDAELQQQFARQFEAEWRLCGGPELEAEYYFSPDRKWRADYYHRPSNTLIELEGGVYGRGRHVRGPGYVEDCFKYNAASLLGYRLIRIATGMATPHYLKQIIEGL